MNYLEAAVFKWNVEGTGAYLDIPSRLHIRLTIKNVDECGGPGHPWMYRKKRVTVKLVGPVTCWQFELRNWISHPLKRQ